VTFTPSAGGNYQINAAYSGAAAATYPSSGTTSLTSVDPTATTLSCAAPVMSVNASIECTATLADAFSPVPPHGTVTFSSAPTTGTFKPAEVVCNWTPSATGGSATCSETFLPVAPGAYTLSAGYSGDTLHAASSGGFQILVTTTPTGGGPGSKPGTGSVTIPPVTGTLTIGATGTVSSKRVASVKLACSGTPCAGALVLTVNQKLRLKITGKRHGKRHKTRTVIKLVTIGRANYNLGAGASKTVAVKLSRAGFKLFQKARHHRLTVTAIASHGVTRVITLTPAKAKKHKHHKHHKRHRRHKRHKK
jgi:hypothetical protein